MSVSETCKEVWDYAKSLLVGLGITGKNFVKPHYRDLSLGVRGQPVHLPGTR
jgi:hypothetical protein